MKNQFRGEDMSFLHEEAEKVTDWPDGMQELYDKKLVSVEYTCCSGKNIPSFSLTELGKRVLNEIDLGLN